jgi:hypothetical protein
VTTASPQLPAFNPKENKFLTILMGALLWGFAWQIRGNGTSDPSVVILLFLLFLSIHYSPRLKFNLVIFAVATFVFGFMRTGWGTFTAQAGIPGLYPGHIVPDGEQILRNNIFDIVVPWWHGYFWLFIVGIAWAGFPALIFGGYFFTKFKYSLKDLAVGVVLFIAGGYVGGYLAELLIPQMSPEYYQRLYLTGSFTRNYESMHGNLATALAIIPVLLYIYFGRQDKGFVKRSLIVMVIFGIGLSLAAVWHAIGRNNPDWPPSFWGFWSLWEYSSGFIIGGLLFWFYGRLSDDELRESDISPGLEFIDQRGRFGQFVIYASALYFFVLYGLQDSMAGSFGLAYTWLDMEMPVSQKTIQTVLLVIVLPIYFFYWRGYLGVAWAKKSFREQCLIALIVLLPVNYLNFVMPYIVAGKLLRLNNAACWLDTISFVIVELYGIYLYRQFRRTTAHNFRTVAGTG